MNEITITGEIVAEKSFSCGASNKSITAQHDEKHEMLLTLPKSDIFVDDQTPTPTCLIRNCEEVGLFDDLRHVNPFEETFRRAVEQNAGQTPSTATPCGAHAEDDTLHTPQVFAQLEEPIVDTSFHAGNELLQKPLGSALSALDVPVGMEDLVTAANVDVGAVSHAHETVHRQISQSGAKTPKLRYIAEKPAAAATMGAISMQNDYTTLSPAITLIQPQIITLSFPSSSRTTVAPATSTAVPVQTVRPFLLPKPAAACDNSASMTTLASSHTSSTTMPTTTQAHHEPSSASLTPTSQLPIKERLKAILSHGSKACNAPLLVPRSTRPTKHRDDKSHVKCEDDCVQRKREAATRYRNKMRNEHKDLRRQNTELRTENAKLRERLQQLEQQLAKERATAALRPTLVNGAEDLSHLAAAQLQIPASTVQLVMNIPKMLVSAVGPPVLQSPVTYRLEKK